MSRATSRGAVRSPPTSTPLRGRLRERLRERRTAAHASRSGTPRPNHGALKTYERELHGAYPHHAAGNTLGLWSRYPLRGVERLDLGGAWPHAIRAVARTPVGDTAVYAVRVPSVRVTFRDGFTVRRRDASAARPAERVARDRTRHVVVLDDLNGSLRDRGLAPLTRGLRPAGGGGSGHGQGFTWPAAFPVVRLDHVLVRGLAPTGATVLPDLGSDHRPVLTGLRSVR